MPTRKQFEGINAKLLSDVSTLLSLGIHISPWPGVPPAGNPQRIPANHYHFYRCGAPFPERRFLTYTGSNAPDVDPSFSEGPAKGRGLVPSLRQARSLGIRWSPPEMPGCSELRTPGIEHTAGDGHETMGSVLDRHCRTQEPHGPAVRGRLPDHRFMVVDGGFDARDDLGSPDLDTSGFRPLHPC